MPEAKTQVDADDLLRRLGLAVKRINVLEAENRSMEDQIAEAKRLLEEGAPMLALRELGG